MTSCAPCSTSSAAVNSRAAIAETFRPLLDSLLHSDRFLVLADFAAYVACQEQVDAAWFDTDRWTRMSIANTAHAGKFSSDRAVREYASRIWGLKRMPTTLE